MIQIPFYLKKTTTDNTFRSPSLRKKIVVNNCLLGIIVDIYLLVVTVTLLRKFVYIIIFVI